MPPSKFSGDTPPNTFCCNILDRAHLPMHKMICMTIVEAKEKFGSKLVIGKDLMELELFFLFSGKSVNLPHLSQASTMLSAAKRSTYSGDQS